MKTLRLAALATFALGLCLAPIAHATDHSAHKHAATADVAQPDDPQAAIPAVLKAIFETPEKPLSVSPVVVAGDWAIADWSTSEQGGRALLKRGAKGWAIHLCSGASLKQADALAKIGIDPAQATHLAHALAHAESTLDPQMITRFDSFEGTVIMDGAATQ